MKPKLISEEPPPIGQWILCWPALTTIAPAGKPFTRTVHKRWCERLWRPAMAKDFTHWMELPEGPEDVEA